MSELSIDKPAFGVSPVQRFRGVLGEIKTEEKTTNPTEEGQKVRTFKVATFNFNVSPNVGGVIIETKEPHPFPTLTFDVVYVPPQSSFGGNRWEALAGSVRRVLGEQGHDLNLLIGKLQEWAQMPATLRQRNPDTNKYEDAQEPCWQLVSVEGIGGAANNGAMEHVLSLIDGKKEPEALAALGADEKVRSDPSIVDMLTNRKLIPTLLETNRITRDAEGVLKKA